MGYSRLVLKIGVIDLDLQCHFGHFDSEFLEIRLVRTITRHRFNRFRLESPNLHPTYILGYSRLLLNMEVIDLDLQGHFGISTHKTAFNVALVHWSRPAKGCYTSQTCSCWLIISIARRQQNIVATLAACVLNNVNLAYRKIVPIWRCI